MARTVVPLTDSKIKNSKSDDKDYSITDGQGLQLLIKKNGSKLWEFRYYSPITNTRRKTSLGNYPNVSLANARKKRAEYLELINNGIDIIDHNKNLKEKIKANEQKKTHTLETVANRFFELEKNNRKLKDDTIILSKQRLENHFFKYLPKKINTVVTDVTYDQTIKVLNKLEKTNKLETLSRVKHLIIKLFKFVYTESIITT